MTNILDKWVFSDKDANTIASLIADGWASAATCTFGGGLLELTFSRDGVMMEMNFRYANDKPQRNLGNRYAEEGVDLCDCGCKYWENDRCIDCNTHVLIVRWRARKAVR